MTLSRAVVLFVMATILLAWLGLAGLGDPGEATVASAEETATALRGSVPPYPMAGL